MTTINKRRVRNCMDATLTLDISMTTKDGHVDLIVTGTVESKVSGAIFTATFDTDHITRLHRIFNGMPELFTEATNAQPRIEMTMDSAVAIYRVQVINKTIEFVLIFKRKWPVSDGQTIAALQEEKYKLDLEIADLKAQNKELATKVATLCDQFCDLHAVTTRQHHILDVLIEQDFAAAIHFNLRPTIQTLLPLLRNVDSALQSVQSLVSLALDKDPLFDDLFAKLCVSANKKLIGDMIAVIISQLTQYHETFLFERLGRMFDMPDVRGISIITNGEPPKKITQLIDARIATLSSHSGSGSLIKILQDLRKRVAPDEPVPLVRIGEF